MRGVHPTKTLLSRFWEKVTIEDNGCWRWHGSTLASGYGMKWNGERVIPVHRWSYMHFVGPIPDGMNLDHLCHTRDETCRGGPTCLHRGCVNPEHLEPVTQLENSQRGRAGVVNGERQKALTHCPQGHAYDEQNTYWRIDRPHARECRACQQERSRQAKAKVGRSRVVR